MNKITSLIVASLITVMGVTAKAADFIIELVPATGSVGTSQVSSIDASKIANIPRQRFSGEVFTFSGSACPSGTIIADGRSLVAATYPDLFSAIAYTNGGAGANFNLPDYRGRFLRMVDGAANRDPDKASRTAMAAGGAIGNNPGSVQSDSFQGHKHSFSGQASSILDGGYNSTVLANYRPDGSSANPNSALPNGVQNPVTDGANGTPRTSSETRPVNANVLFCVIL